MLSDVSAYRDALVVDVTASEQRLAAAAEVLTLCSGVVLFEGSIALRATRTEILCAVIDPEPSAHRCEEEYKVLVENAARALESSKLRRTLPKRALRWIVVDAHGTHVFGAMRAGAPVDMG